MEARERAPPLAAGEAAARASVRVQPPAGAVVVLVAPGLVLAAQAVAEALADFVLAQVFLLRQERTTQSPLVVVVHRKPLALIPYLAPSPQPEAVAAGHIQTLQARV